MRVKALNVFLTAEMAILFLILPVVLFFTGTRLGIYFSMWGAGLYGLIVLVRQPDFSWHALWHGDGWQYEGRRSALIRFAVLAAVLGLFTFEVMPQRLFGLPRERFVMWLAIMVLYPLVSTVPQEIFYRSFYFRRYGRLLPFMPYGLVLNGLLFGLAHIVFDNWVAPVFSALGGMLFAYSFNQHRSLKWAVIEHSLYGCWVFTVGIGWYFYAGNFR